MTPLQFHRRQLHRFQFSKDGIRRLYGGTISINLKHGSLIKQFKYGLVYVGGTSKGRISLCSLNDGKRLCENAKLQDCKFLTYNSWRIVK